jgi:hypothetical protein
VMEGDSVLPMLALQPFILLEVKQRFQNAGNKKQVPKPMGCSS